VYVCGVGCLESEFLTSQLSVAGPGSHFLFVFCLVRQGLAM
jgi:hypothetical protein